MRKYAGIFIAILMLVVPALANAFTLSVKVVGGSAAMGNTVVATDTATSAALKTFTGGTGYIYPTAPATLTVNVAAGYTATYGGNPILNGATIPVSAAASTQFVFTAPALVGFSINQTAGGVIRAELPNNTTTTGNPTGLVAGSQLNLLLQANSGYQIDNYTIGAASPVAVGAASATVPYTVVGGDVVTASFSQTGSNQVALLNASLLAPLAGFTSSAVKCSAVSNDVNATYAFSVSGLPTTSNTSFFSFTPAAAGNYTVTVVVNAGKANQTTLTKVVAVTAASAYNVSQCTSCHASSTPAIVANYKASIHGASGNDHSTCQGCHTTDAPHSAGVDTKNISTTIFTVTSATAVNTIASGAVYCTLCHKGAYPIPHPTNLNAGITCAGCHTDPKGQGTATGDAHAIQPLPKCIDCHAVQQAQVAPGLVNDNAGVRNIVAEFGKWSHHVTGATLNDAHCAACHLEGKASNGEIVVDSGKHMVDGVIHLRNVHDDSEYAWDPAAPNHTNMDNFCMTCHSATGATSTGSQAIQAYINANGVAAPGKVASALNPFGDTISNRYDKMQRPAVTNVNDQFGPTATVAANAGNNSHHGVKGPRYTGRTRVAGPRQIASAATFAGNSTATLQGVRSTIYDAGNFNALYTPLENATGEAAPRTGAATLGDDSTLHCGDCHTVGQWKVGSSKNAAGAATPVAIGAHGSNNEYLLRNSIGTDERHTQVAYTVAGSVVTYTNPNGAFLVCFNCHAQANYGLYMATGMNNGNAAGSEVIGQIQSHAGEYAEAGRCNGAGNTIPFNGYTTGKATDGSQFETRFSGPVTATDAANGFVNPDFGNIFGIQCLNCHNSGTANAFGGIHGSANNTDTANATVAAITAAAGVTVNGGAYIDGKGNVTKVERFLPGLGDAMHVPGTLGGVTGGTTISATSTKQPATYNITTGGVTNDTNWEQKHWLQTANTVINYKTKAVTGTAYTGAGCYTLGADSNNGNATAALQGPSVTGQGGPATALLDTWGGCEDHGAVQGGANHGFLKRIIRPVTY